MPNFQTPGIYVLEEAGGPRPIQAVGTSTAGFVGEAPRPVKKRENLNRAVPIDNWSQFVREYIGEKSGSTPLAHAVYGFFLNGGRRCYIVDIEPGTPLVQPGRIPRTGLDLLEEIDEIAIVAAPGRTDIDSYEALLSHCERLQDRVAILDAPKEVDDVEHLTRVATPARRGGGDSPEAEARPVVGLRPRQSDHGFGAFYFPWLRVRELLSDELVDVPPSGHIAGIWARTDATRGVHKAPANELVRGALDLTYRVTDAEQEVLNPQGVNCIRSFVREGIRVWGARTVAPGASEWRYLNVRRLFSMIEESIAESTRWIVFEPNDQTLWKSIRRDITAFLMRLWRDGALMGRTPAEAFFVRCDEETNPPEIIDAGQVVTVIGIAPVKPAEFIIFRISQSSVGVELETQGGSNA